MVRNARSLNCFDVFFKPVSLVVFLDFLYCAVALLFPFAGFRGVAHGAMLMAVFVLLFVFFSFCIFSVGTQFIAAQRFSFEGGGSCALPFLLSIVGIAFLVIDKVYFRGVDFLNMTPAEIRNKISSDSVGQVSSLFSLLGNLLQCSVVVAAFNSIYKDSGFRFFFKQSLFFLVVFASSYLLGGRTPLLVYLVIVFSIYISSGRGVSVFSAVKFIFPAVIAAFAFALSIFALRASAGGIDSSEYLSGVLLHLGAANVDSSLIVGSGVYGDILNYFYATIAYLVHPFWVSSEIVLGSSGGGNISFYTALFLLSKFISVDLDLAKHAYYELFSSLPGGLYYDYGFWGVAIYSFFLAVIGFWGFAILAMSRGAFTLGRVLIVFCLATLFLSPLLHSLNFSFFIFYMSILFIYAFARDLFHFLCFVIANKKR